MNLSSIDANNANLYNSFRVSSKNNATPLIESKAKFS